VRYLGRIFVLFLVSSCLSIDDYQNIGFENAKKHQQEIYKNYIEDKNKYKVLVRTNIPVREVQKWDNPDRSGMLPRCVNEPFVCGFLPIDGNVKKYYYSVEQETYEHSIVEAFEYCKRDNTYNYQEICELDMIGNFNATEFEKNYAKNIYESNLYQITILNIGFLKKHPGVEFYGPSPIYNHQIPANCYELDQLEHIAPGSSLDGTKISFNWSDCKTAIRLNIDEILKLYDRPNDWDSI
tara:strand:+ start:420 stop:1136 length:717 start_codon:yes stop_codon:yes gene_type:complete